MIGFYDPQVDFSQGGIGEPFEVYAFRTMKVIAGRLADGAGELDATDAADAFRLQGDGACNMRIAAKLRAVPRGRVSSDDQRVVLLIPGIEARGAPWPLLTYGCGGDAQQVMAPEERSDTFMKCWLFHRCLLVFFAASCYYCSFHL